MEEKVTYFENFGADNTEETLSLATERAKARGINKILLASTRGDTARRYAELLEGTGMKMVVVPHQYGFGQGGQQRFPRELIAELEKKGHFVYFGTMLFHTDGLYGERAPTLIANVLRTFCQGMKVAVELILMAVNGGCVEAGEQVVVVTGTGRGADTAIVATAAPSTHLEELHIREIICKPLETRSRPTIAPSQPPPRPPEQASRPQ